MKYVKDTILDVLEVCKCPYITASVVARQLKSEIWKEDEKLAYISAYSSLKSMIRRDHINYDEDTNVFYLKGMEHPKGTDYLDHNEAVIALITNYYIRGYDVNWGGRGNADAVVNGRIAIEVDRRNHTSNRALRNQVDKYDSKDYDKVLYVSLPARCKPASVKYDKEYQFPKSKGLRKRIQSFRLKGNLKKKFLFATYVEASDPYGDPLKKKIWQDMSGHNTNVI